MNVDILRLIQTNNCEKLGKYYLQKATSYCLNSEFKLSYSFFIEGLDLLTCDCNDGWRLDFEKEYENTFIFQDKITSPYYFFVKAFILSFDRNYENLLSAMDAIDKYLNLKQDDYGFYVKGKIYSALKNENKALFEFYKAQKIKYSHRVTYRIGRIKSQFFKTNALLYLFESFNTNTSSYCCLRFLKQNCLLLKINFELPENCSNPLITSFVNSDDELVVSAGYAIFLNKEIASKTNQLKVFRETKEEFNDFMRDLIYRYPIISDNPIPEHIFHTEQENVIKNEDSRILVSLESEYYENLDLDFWTDYNEYWEDEENYYECQNDYQSIFDNPYYNDDLDLDQQSIEFWDSI